MASLSTHSMIAPTPINAITGILTTFQTIPLVALGEAHCLQQEWDLITKLLQHRALPRIVNDIVVEIGNARYQPIVDRFVAGEPVASTELRPVWRDCVGSLGSAGDPPIYEQFFRTVREINQALPEEQRLRVLLGDPPIDWRLVHHKDDLLPVLDQRDSHYVTVVEQEVLAKGRRGLLIAGRGHFSRLSDRAPSQGNVTQLLEQRHPGSVFVVVPHVIYDDVVMSRQAEVATLEAQLAAWPIPSLAPIHDTWLSALAATLFFADEARLIGADGESTVIKTPFISLDGQPMEGVPLGAMADAYLYLGPYNTLTFVDEVIDTVDEIYMAERRRRWALMHG